MANYITKPVPITIHEQFYPALKKAAMDTPACDGNVSAFVRGLIYKHLLDNNYITQIEVIEAYV